MASEKALPLNGEGLGWGVSELVPGVAHEEVSTLPPAPPPAPLARAPQSPTLSPSRGKGVFEHPAHAKGAVKRARHLRSDMTSSEHILWKELRKLDLHIRRQAPIGKYIADFIQHSAKLVIEVDGGRHDLPENQLHDQVRDEWLRSQGYRVLRVRDQEVYDNPPAVAQKVAALLIALPLNGEGLGWGVSELVLGMAHEEVSTLPPAPPPAPLARAPQSPTLSPSRGKGDSEQLISSSANGKGA
jgi:very-short-patch-repair endonuclease